MYSKIVLSLIGVAATIIGGSELLSQLQQQTDYLVARENLYTTLESAKTFTDINLLSLDQAYTAAIAENSNSGIIISTNGLLSCSGSVCLSGNLVNGSISINSVDNNP